MVVSRPNGYVLGSADMIIFSRNYGEIIRGATRTEFQMAYYEGHYLSRLDSLSMNQSRV